MSPILIVDDELDIREIYTAALRWSGFEVITARHGAEALDMIAKHDVSLVISDIYMPVLGGCELLYELRRRNNYVPLIMITNNAESSLLAEDLAARSVRCVLRKPVPLEELVNRVRTILTPGDTNGSD